MAELRLNENQLAAVTKRGTNILVSAAAGSGKTTVLVERVIRKIIDEGVDIDSLIIMTFTKAAAANMRAKIYKSLRQALDREDLGEEAKNKLKIQMMKIYGANICTIDSLCMNIVKENFQEIDIDPSFRIADDAEMSMIKKDVLAKVIERNYQNPTEEFMEFVNYYIDKNDSKIDEIVLTLYNFAQSHPEPIRWLNSCAATYMDAGNISDGKDEIEYLWHAKLKEIVMSKIYNLMLMCEKGIEICDANYGPYLFRDNFLNLQGKLLDLKEGSYDQIGMGLLEIVSQWEELSRKKDANIDAELRSGARNLYSDIKKEIAKLKERFFEKDLLSMYEDIAKCANVAKAVVDLTKEFYYEFSNEKKDRLVADFGDISHYALKVLISHNTNEDGEEEILRDEKKEMVFSKIADKIALATDEIIVDEYQDTNHMQDTLIDALSAKRFGRPNVFMVGDVKQSIYGFRMACPELFNQKRDLYEKGIGGELIILDENHRSRKEVLDLTNFVFEQAMISEIGGIDYTNNNELKLGGEFEKADDLHVLPEIIMINDSGNEAKLASSYEVATRIEQLVDSGFNYSDITILTRTSNNPGLERILSDRKIPAIKASNKGFFDTFEVRLAIDLFRIIDNPYQDIPMCAVLLSPIAGANSNELARIKNNFEGRDFSVYEAIKVDEKYNWFINKLNEYHEKSLWMDIEEFVEFIFNDSGLYNIVSAMPKGDSRKANLDFVKSLCTSYSKGSYAGLFNFIRYIDEIQKADIDFGSAQVEGTLDAVQMMTIHKSKGLEFKVCIIMNSGQQYNKKDLEKPILLDKELGMGIELRDVNSRIKTRTLLMETIATKKEVDIYAEELRLLYVAMTRAIDKLIIVGNDGRMKTRMALWESEKGKRAKKLTPAEVLSCNSYLSLLGQTLCHDGKRADKELPRFSWEIKLSEDVELSRAREVFEDEIKKKDIEERINKDLEPATLTFDYEFEEATKTQVKISASALENKQTDRDFDLESKYVKSNKGLVGTERGNAYHKLFEKYDFEKSAKDNVKLLFEDGFLTKEQVECINIEDIEKFASSNLGQRMKKAAKENTLRREQQFVAKYIDSGENRLIQGIIDAFFEEDNEIVLVDYKTDKNKDENYFVQTYKPQQDAYSDAIEKATNKKVKEKILYITEIGKELQL